MIDRPKPTLKELASELGLSISVVSRVLNDKAAQYRISEKTQALVRESAARRGFSANQVARGLRLRRTQTIGFLIPDISNSFFSLIARSLENAARRRGYSVILCDAENDEGVEASSLKLLRDRSVDGLLIAPVGQHGEHIRSLHRQGVPIVLIDRFFEEPGLPYVAFDNIQGAHDGTVHLLENGHRVIGFIQGARNTKPNLERLQGYSKALGEYQISIDESLIRGEKFEEQDGYDSASALLERTPRPTALFASSAPGALGAMRACMNLGLKIPGDVSLIGFDEYRYASLLNPPLSTISQETEKIGKMASSLLLDWLESGKPPSRTKHILPTRLVRRESVGPVAVKAD